MAILSCSAAAAQWKMAPCSSSAFQAAVGISGGRGMFVIECLNTCAVIVILRATMYSGRSRQPAILKQSHTYSLAAD